jgi:hypothetical protein
MLVMRGKVARGLGAATSTIAQQMPYVAPLFPEIKDCHLASINVLLEQGLRVFRPDFVTEPIPWAGGSGEVFSFLRIGLEIPIGSEPRQAWIYIPHGSPHYYNPFTAEVIAPWIEGVTNDMACQIHIPRFLAQCPLFIV